MDEMKQVILDYVRNEYLDEDEETLAAAQLERTAELLFRAPQAH